MCPGYIDVFICACVFVRYTRRGLCSHGKHLDKKMKHHHKVPHSLLSSRFTRIHLLSHDIKICGSPEWDLETNRESWLSRYSLGRKKMRRDCFVHVVYFELLNNLGDYFFHQSSLFILSWQICISSCVWMAMWLNEIINIASVLWLRQAPSYSTRSRLSNYGHVVF